MINSFIDLLMFRQGGEYENDTTEPVITVGSIVWGVILRAALVLIAWVFIIYEYQLFDEWWAGLFVIWLIALYPGYTQYKIFEGRVKKLGEETLCGSCRHFKPQGQLCQVYDEHVSTQHIPCEGLSWEPFETYED